MKLSLCHHYMCFSYTPRYYQKEKAARSEFFSSAPNDFPRSISGCQCAQGFDHMSLSDCCSNIVTSIERLSDCLHPYIQVLTVLATDCSI